MYVAGGQRPRRVTTTSLAQCEQGGRWRLREQTAWLLLFRLQEADGDAAVHRQTSTDTHTLADGKTCLVYRKTAA